MREDLRFFSAGGTAPFYISLAGVTFPDPSYIILRPASDVAVIEYVTKGDGYVVRCGNITHVTKDTVYFLPAGELHHYYADHDSPYEKIFLNVSGEFAKKISSAYSLDGDCFFDGEGLKPLFMKIPEAMHSNLSEKELQAFLQGLFVQIVSTLSQRKEERFKNEEAVKMKSYIDSNLGRIVSTKELSDLIFRSQDYALKLFKREFGKTPYAYQIEQKMVVATSLLTDTKMPVGEIAYSLGYDDLQYFSNLFRKKCGKSPTSYRKEKNFSIDNTP